MTQVINPYFKLVQLAFLEGKPTELPTPELSYDIPAEINIQDDDAAISFSSNNTETEVYVSVGSGSEDIVSLRVIAGITYIHPIAEGSASIIISQDASTHFNATSVTIPVSVSPISLPAPNPQSVERAVLTADLHNNSWDNQNFGFQLWNTSSGFKFLTDAPTITLNGITSTRNINAGAIFAKLAVMVDGALVDSLTFDDNGEASKDIILGYGTKTVEILNGLTIANGSDAVDVMVLGTSIKSVVFPANTAFVVIKPTIKDDAVAIFADSISVGTCEGNPAVDGWDFILKRRHPNTTIVPIGYGGKMAKFTAATDANIQKHIEWLHNVLDGATNQTIYYALSINDVGNAVGTAAQIVSWDRQILEACASAFPTARIIVQTALYTANAAGQLYDDVRDQTIALCNEKGWDVIIGEDLYSNTGIYTWDSVHPSVLGHIAYADAIEEDIYNI